MPFLCSRFQPVYFIGIMRFSLHREDKRKPRDEGHSFDVYLLSLKKLLTFAVRKKIGCRISRDFDKHQEHLPVRANALVTF